MLLFLILSTYLSTIFLLILQVRLCREKKSGTIYAMKKLKKIEMVKKGQVSYIKRGLIMLWQVPHHLHNNITKFIVQKTSMVCFFIIPSHWLALDQKGLFLNIHILVILRKIFFFVPRVLFDLHKFWFQTLNIIGVNSFFFKLPCVAQLLACRYIC